MEKPSLLLARPMSTASPRGGFMTTRKSTFVYSRHLVMDLVADAHGECSSKKGWKEKPPIQINCEKRQLNFLLLRFCSWFSWYCFLYSSVFFDLGELKDGFLAGTLFTEDLPFFGGKWKLLGKENTSTPRKLASLVLSRLRRPATWSSACFCLFYFIPYADIFCEPIYVTSYYEFSTLSGKSLKKLGSRAWTKHSVTQQVCGGLLWGKWSFVLLHWGLKIRKIELNGI